MRVLVFDTETTGLPEKDAIIFQHNKWPHIIQLSYILYDTQKHIFDYYNYYISIDDSIIITPESFNIHKLTREFLNTNGVSITTALTQFNLDLNTADIIVGHNISFDKKIVLVECYRNKIEQKFTYMDNNNIKIKKTEFCTMKNGKSFCNIVRINKLQQQYLKTPSLKELFNKCFPDEELPCNLHDAFIDILITFRCYYKLISNSDILNINNNLKEIYYEKLNFV